MTNTRGKSSIGEAEQEAQEEEPNTETSAATTRLVCHSPTQTNPVPFREMTDFQATPGPTTEPSTQDPGDPKEIDLD